MSALIDIDDTYLNFKVPLHEVCAANNIPVRTDIWDSFDGEKSRYDWFITWLKSNPGFIYGLRPFEGAKEGLAELRQIHHGKVAAVTSPLRSGVWMEERYAALEEMHAFQHTNIHLVSGKHWIPADILIEDKPFNAWNWATSHAGVAILLRHPWTEKEIEVMLAKRQRTRGIVLLASNWTQIMEIARAVGSKE